MFPNPDHRRRRRFRQAVARICGPRAASLLAAGACLVLLVAAIGAAQTARLALSRAEMCEAITDFSPRNICAVVSVSRKVVHCFTLFDPVPAKTEIFHRWFHRDQPAATFKLTLQPPRWASYSSMQLRPGDKGPWRVEITDAGGTVFKILRFSVTD